MRIVLAAVAALTALLVSPLAAGPAQATVTGSTSSGDAVLYPQCQQHEIDYAIEVSPGTVYWDLEIQVERSDDTQSEGTVLSSTKSSPTTGSVEISMCGAEPPGRWTVHATGVYEFAYGVRTPYQLPDSTFQVRRAVTHTSLGAKRVRHQPHRVRLISTVTDERAGGFGPTEGAPVDLQRLVDGTWHKVRGSRERTLHGHTTMVVRAVRGATYRAVTYGLGNYDGSQSTPVRVRRR